MRKLSNKAALELVKELVEMERLQGLGFHELVKELRLNEKQEQALLYRYELKKVSYMNSKGGYGEFINPLIKKYKEGGESAVLDHLGRERKSPKRKVKGEGRKGVCRKAMDAMYLRKCREANLSELSKVTDEDVDKMKQLRAEGAPYKILCGIMGVPEGSLRRFLLSIKTSDVIAKEMRAYAQRTGRVSQKDNVMKLPVNRILCSARLGASL